MRDLLRVKSQVAEFRLWTPQAIHQLLGVLSAVKPEERSHELQLLIEAAETVLIIQGVYASQEQKSQ